MNFELIKADGRSIPSGKGEIRACVCVGNEMPRLPYFLRYYRELGVDRFFFVANLSTDGSLEYLLAQPDCHVFTCDGSYFDQNTQPPAWQNALLSVHGDGHWSLMVDADELLVYPGLAELGLSGLCEYLERSGARALEAPLIDMYGDGPVMQGTYTLGQPFIEACPYLDAKAPRERRVDDWCPPTQLFGGVRERIFWRGRFARTQPPTLSKVPLVKWRKGTAYSASTHLISRTTLSELRGGLLHFKFLPGFFNDLIAQIEKNRTGVEKSLQERAAYYDGLMRNPNLAFRDEHSVRYESPEQLVRLGWLRTSPAFERYVAEKSRVPLKRAAADVTRSPRRRQPVGSAPTTDRAGG